MIYAYKRRTARGFHETVKAVELSVVNQGFTVLYLHDIGQKLASRGFPINPLVIFEVSPVEVSANEALLMPCRINVYEEANEVVVAALRPSIFAAIFPEHKLDAIAEKADRKVIAIVDGAI